MDPAIFTSSHLVSHNGADQCNANSLDNDNEKRRKKKEDGKKGVNSSGAHRHVPGPLLAADLRSIYKSPLTGANTRHVQSSSATLWMLISQAIDIPLACMQIPTLR